MNKKLDFKRVFRCYEMVFLGIKEISYCKANISHPYIKYTTMQPTFWIIKLILVTLMTSYP